MTSITKTPWRVDDDGETIKVRDPDGGAICTMHHLGAGGKFGPRRGSMEVRNNANLMAASPLLLTACAEAYLLIKSEFADAESQALEGEYVSKEARPAWDALCSALAEAGWHVK